MIDSLISWSIRNRFIVLLLFGVLALYGIYSLKATPVDAIPDLSENEVIVYTRWQGQSPQLIEDQVTYPLVTNLQGIPGVKDIRATSMFGMSFIYVVFKDKVDLYWARSRVLERLNYAQRLLPPGVVPSLGPDATGVGQVFWYTLDAKSMDPATLRTLQDWYVKYGLQAVPGVSEVASFGGFQKQYQIDLDPGKLQYYGIPYAQVVQAVRANNNDAGAGVVDLNGSQYMVRSLGYLKGVKDLERLSVATRNGTPIRIRDLGHVQLGTAPRLGIVDQNGQGDAVGGVVIMRYGANAEQVIQGVKAKMKDLAKGLPAGVHFQVAYDRSTLIQASVKSIEGTILEEILLVCVVIVVFLMHFRSALVIILSIPISILIAFICMHLMGLSSNIMSLSGIAIAIGVIVDNGIVMVENAYRHLTE